MDCQSRDIVGHVKASSLDVFQLNWAARAPSRGGGGGKGVLTRKAKETVADNPVMRLMLSNALAVLCRHDLGSVVRSLKSVSGQSFRNFCGVEPRSVERSGHPCF